ncbi:MAG: hypothetical protein ABEJ05_11350 [Haloglomus sp.]
MASQRQFGRGTVVLALLTAGAAAWLESHHHTTLAATGAVVALALGAVGVPSALGRAFVEGSDNHLAGATAVFGTVAAFGLLVATLMLAVE